MLSAGYLFPFLGHFQGCADQIPLQNGEEGRIKSSYLSTIPSTRHGTVS